MEPDGPGPAGGQDWSSNLRAERDGSSACFIDKSNRPGESDSGGLVSGAGPGEGEGRRRARAPGPALR